MGDALNADVPASDSHDQVLLYPADTYKQSDASSKNKVRNGLVFQSIDVGGESSSLPQDTEGSRTLQVWGWIHKRSRDSVINGEDQHRWYFIVDGAKALRHMRSDSIHPWKKLHDRIATLSDQFNPAVPVYLGDQYFHPGITPRTGPGFPEPDEESWLPICKVDHVLLNTGFLDLLYGSPYDTADSPCSGPELQGEVVHATSMEFLASCIDEHLGLRCRSLSSWIKRGDKSTAAGVDEWGPTWRHSAWNCSLAAGRKDGPISAVCQAPLRRNPEHADLKKLAIAPEWIGELYKVVHSPKAREEKVNAQSKSREGRANSTPKSWLASSGSRRNGPNTDADAEQTIVPVAHLKDEPRDAVLAVGSGETLNPVPIEFFVKSLRSTGCKAEVILFLDNRRVAEYVGMADKYGGIRLISIETDVLNKKFKYGKPSVLFRFALYLHFMSLPESRIYRRCLHADLFDTYFQRDPFAVVDMRGGLAVFAENSQIRIGHCSFHRYWYNGCQQIGKLLGRAHAELRICMGVVLGFHAAFLNFLKMTLFYVMQRCNDQGVLNMLTHSGKYAEVMPVTVFTSQDGAVIHLNTDWHISIKADGVVRNGVGGPFSVVHQWDRIGKLRAPVSDDGRLETKLVSSLVGASTETFMKREKVLRQKWLGGEKHDWSKTGRVAASCIVVGPVAQHQEVLCFSNTDAMERRRENVLFCPTHSPVAALPHEKVTAWFGEGSHSKAMATGNRYEGGRSDGDVARKIQNVAASPYLTCTSEAIVSKCAKQHWCPVSKKIVAAAISACKELQPQNVSDDDLKAQVAYNVIFRCLNPSVASHHRQPPPPRMKLIYLATHT